MALYRKKDLFVAFIPAFAENAEIFHTSAEEAQKSIDDNKDIRPEMREFWVVEPFDKWFERICNDSFQSGRYHD